MVNEVALAWRKSPKFGFLEINPEHTAVRESLRTYGGGEVLQKHWEARGFIRKQGDEYRWRTRDRSKVWRVPETALDLFSDRNDEMQATS